jgi:A/G-specific adenine glycosylase
LKEEQVDPKVRESLSEIVEPLLNWFSTQARILPWRDDPTAYRVWISEIMLQQTRVEAVKPYYERFMERLPDIKELALVPEEELLKLWEGLGYYNRARNLQKTSKIILEKYHGILPQDYELLLELPGIGSYTAGAIASIAYHKKVPAVDGNVLRVISRILLYDKNVLAQSAKREIEQLLIDIMPKDSAAFNQSLMELGALVCLPNGKPKCDICPLKKRCQALQKDCIASFPKKQVKKARTIENKTILIIQDAGKTAIRKRPATGLLAGLYEFPVMEGHVLENDVLSYLKQCGLQTLRIQKLENSKHIFSHREWHMIAYEIKVDELAPLEKADQQFLFATVKDTEDKYPIPAAFSMYSKYLNIQLGIKKHIEK